MTGGLALAAPPPRDQGDWPCRQIKVADLALAAIWAGPPIAEAQKHWRDDSEISDLAARLAARRTPIETAEKLIVDFAKAAGERRNERLTLLFAALYDTLDSERSQVVAGLERFGRTQKETAEELRRETEELREAQDAHVDQEKLLQRSEKLQWDMRIFDERRKSVSYVCESPALIEQRLGALARAIEAAMG
ncbi:MAG TPA: hypothetical protein VEH76_09235 [Methylocystis sp.]|nr:hypothetical protein [Methylocystis sp.]